METKIETKCMLKSCYNCKQSGNKPCRLFIYAHDGRLYDKVDCKCIEQAVEKGYNSNKDFAVVETSFQYAVGDFRIYYTGRQADKKLIEYKDVRFIASNSKSKYAE